MCLSSQVNSQQLTRILFIFDASNSMNGNWGEDTKISQAREILCETVDELEGIPNLELALRVYGHQSPVTPTFQDCEDTKLEVPFGPANHATIKGVINSIEPKGTTPIARSLEAAADDFPDKNSRNVIILITDGLEACDQFPCEVARTLRAKGIDVTPFVVGLGVDLKYLNDLSCIGKLYEATNSDTFRKVMHALIGDILLNTTVQINLNDIHLKPTETNVTLFLYKAGTKELVHTFTHTLNKWNNPDTLTVIDPKMQYDMVVNTLPKVEVKDIKLYMGQHNTIKAYCPQGLLKVYFDGATKKGDVKIRVSQNGKTETLNVQTVGQIQKYLVGTYDLEILTLPRIYYKGVSINQSEFTNISIPGSGIFNYNTSKNIVGQIFVKNEKGTFDWVCDLNPDVLKDKWYLQPGSYKVVYRNRDAVSTIYTNVKEFSIRSGFEETVNL